MAALQYPTSTLTSGMCVTGPKSESVLRSVGVVKGSHSPATTVVAIYSKLFKLRKPGLAVKISVLQHIDDNRGGSKRVKVGNNQHVGLGWTITELGRYRQDIQTGDLRRAPRRCRPAYLQPLRGRCR